MSHQHSVYGFFPGGDPRRFRWAHWIGADSVDSSQPLWSRRALRAWLAEFGIFLPLADPEQGRLFA